MTVCQIPFHTLERGRGLGGDRIGLSESLGCLLCWEIQCDKGKWLPFRIDFGKSVDVIRNKNSVISIVFHIVTVSAVVKRPRDEL